MTHGPTVSVAMATYNGAKHLQEQLASIARQTRPPDELVVGDDGSTDGTPELLARFGRESGIQVAVTRNPVRLGSTQNFAACLQRCAGEIVLLSDQDDVWRPDRVERTVAALQARPSAAYAFSDGEVVDSEGRRTGARLWQKAFFGARGLRAFEAGRGADALLRTNVVTGATMGIRRDRLGPALPIPAGWVHDAWIAFVLEVAHGAVAIEEPLVEYRQHVAQQIGVVRLTPRGVLDLLRRQDSAFYRREAANYRALAARVAALDVPRAARMEARVLEKVGLLELRAAFREAPLRAAPAFVAAVVRGRYHRYGLGAKQAAFDLAGAALARARPAPAT